MSDDALLTPAEASEFLRVPIKTLVHWRTRHVGPKYMRVGEGRGRIRYRLADLNGYATANTITPGETP